MSAFYHETEHRAGADYPYVQCHSRNLIYRPHFHHDIELAMVVSGRAQVLCDGKELWLGEGDICVFMPGEIHSFVSANDNLIHILKISCKHSVEKVDFTRLRFCHPLPAASQLKAALREAILTVEREDRERRLGFGYAVREQVARIVGLILRSGEGASCEPSQQKKHMLSLSMLEKVNAYIEEHYTESVTLSEAAAATGFSSYYFAHLFKDITGSTFYHHLLTYRCEKAAAMLQVRERKMVEIAVSCGFSDVRSFNRAFKKVMGETPTAYRLKNYI